MSRSRNRSPSISRSRSPVKRRASPEVGGTADESTCPFLIRLFVTKGRHTPMLDFDDGKFPIRDEFQAYGWKHSTPTSLIALLFPSFPPPYRSLLARYSFRHVYVDASQRGLYRHRDLVSFTGRDLMTTVAPPEPRDKPAATAAMDMELDDAPAQPRGKGKKVEEKTLQEYGFVTGDLLSVSVHVPEPKTPAGAPRMSGGPGGGNGVGPGVSSYGWGERTVSGREAHPADKAGGWSRGEPLPPQGHRGGGPRGSVGGRDEPAGGGSWRGGAGGGGGGIGIGIRVSGRRSKSPPVRERNGDRNGEYGRGRSRSPEPRERRQSWSRR